MSLLVETGIARLSPLVATRMNTKRKSAFPFRSPRSVLSRARVATSGDRLSNSIEVALFDRTVVAIVRYAGSHGDQAAIARRQGCTNAHDHGGYVLVGEQR